MARPRRIDAVGTHHHVMNRGVDHQRIFFTDHDRLEFGRLLSEIHERFGVEIVAYCLLDNHFHLIVRSAEGRLSEAMQYLGSVFASGTNVRAGRDGHLFRARFHSTIIDSDAYLLAAVRYVHRNALDVRGVERPTDYRWSSHRAYLGLRPVADWLDIDRVLSFFGSTVDFGRFVDRPLRRGGPIAVSALRSAIESAVDIHIPDSDRRRAADAAAIALIADRVSTADRCLIEDAFGGRSSNAWASARSRARRRLDSQPELEAVVETALSFARDVAVAEEWVSRRGAA